MRRFHCCTTTSAITTFPRHLPQFLTSDGDVVEIEIVPRVRISPVVAPRRQHELSERVEGDVHLNVAFLLVEEFLGSKGLAFGEGRGTAKGVGARSRAGASSTPTVTPVPVQIHPVADSVNVNWGVCWQIIKWALSLIDSVLFASAAM